MDKLKVLITGAKGQLGMDLVKHLTEGDYKVVGLGRDELNITDYDQVKDIMDKTSPHVVIHAAAYTKVDQAETDSDEAFRVNAIGTRNIAVASERIKAKLVFVSTDYVFDGKANQPFHEYKPTSPINVYGETKLAGEYFVQNLHSKFFIVRTSWLYGLYGPNFVKTMLKLASERSELNVVSDQIGSPTYTADLANFICELMNTEYYGIYHASNTGSCSWYEFAKAIFEESGLNHIKVNPITTNEFQRSASRPSYSVMDHLAIRINDLHALPHWRESLITFLKKYQESSLS